MSIDPSTGAVPTAPLVLHVTEALGGGIEAALRDYARATPQLRHALLFTRRGQFGTQDLLHETFCELIDAGRGVGHLVRRYRSTVARLRPDVVHLHSAWAGLVGRSLPRTGHRAAVVYSPHSFYFERQDIRAVQRHAAMAVERILARRTDLHAVLSAFEAAETSRLGGTPVVIPNVADVPVELAWTGRDGDEIVAVGRIAAQKDPDFLLAVKREVDLQLPNLRWTWLGAGEPHLEQRLRDGGVTVTGWMPRAEVLRRLAAASVYLHTAAWEGSPIVLLETAQLGVPTVARSIPALVALGHDDALSTPETVADRVISTVVMPQVGLRPAADQAEQTAVLTALYGGLITGSPAVPATDLRTPRPQQGAQPSLQPLPVEA